jgi:hypothetical protein
MYEDCPNRWDVLYINDRQVAVYNATWDARLNCSEIQKVNGTWYYWVKRPYHNRNTSDPIKKMRIEVMNCGWESIYSAEYIV